MKWTGILLLLFNWISTTTGQNFFSDHIDLAGFSDAAWQVSEKDGNYYILTTSFCDLTPDPCVGLIKLDSNFQIAWKKSFQQLRIGIFTSMAVNDADILIAGRRLDETMDTLDVTVLKVDFDGNLINQWYYGTLNDDNALGITAADNNGFLLSFNADIGVNKGQQWVYRCDATGSVLWKQRLEAQYRQVFINSIVSSPENQFILGMSGCRAPDCQQLEGFVLKLNDNGEPLFRVARDTTWTIGQENTYAAFTKDGGAVFSRLEEAQPGVWERQVIYRVDSTGAQLWEYHYDAHDYHRLWNLKEMRNGDIVAVGFNEDHPFIDTTEEYLRYLGGWIIRLSPNGEKKWERIIGDLRYPSDNFGEILDIVENEDGGLLAVGTMLDTFPNGIPAVYNRDVWLLHLDSLGCVEPGCTGVFQGILGTSNLIDLSTAALGFSAFPNPASDGLFLSLSDPSSCPVSTVTLIDLFGQIVFQKNWPAGQKTCYLNLTNLQPGAYCIRLQNRNGNTGLKKVIVQK